MVAVHQLTCSPGVTGTKVSTNSIELLPGSSPRIWPEKTIEQLQLPTIWFPFYTQTS